MPDKRTQPIADEKESFLHLEPVSRKQKTNWINAAAKAKLSLFEWVERELNRAAAKEEQGKT